MLKKIPLRFRLTLISVLLLLACCLGLTIILNFSANKMANIIEASPMTPAVSLDDPLSGRWSSEEPTPLQPFTPSAASQQARMLFLKQSIVYMLFIVAIGGFFIYFITGKTMRPLNELSRQMKNRTVYNLSEALPIPESHDEIASLTAAFNEMTQKLDDAFAMQKRFSQSAAHELRTPLTVLKTKVDVFQKRANHTQAEYEKFLETVGTQTDRLSELVRDLLDLANMDAVECDQKIDLSELLSDIVSELSGMAQEKQVKVALRCPELTIQGSESLLRRAFHNLIENSIKYNVPGGHVEILSKQQGGHAVVIVTDTGIGIPPEQKDLIFEPFYRVDKSRSRRMGGAGLGLAMVRDILDMHKGRIAVADNPSGGSIFTVTL